MCHYFISNLNTLLQHDVIYTGLSLTAIMEWFTWENMSNLSGLKKHVVKNVHSPRENIQKEKMPSELISQLKKGTGGGRGGLTSTRL
jgi:hypothetical protein